MLRRPRELVGVVSRDELWPRNVVRTETGWRVSVSPFLRVHQVKARSPNRPQLKLSTLSHIGFGGPSAGASTAYWIPSLKLVTQPIGAGQADAICAPRRYYDRWLEHRGAALEGLRDLS